MLVINTLGGLSLSLNGETLKDLGTRKAEALLVYLAIEGKPIQREVLAGLLWPESSQSKALVSLRGALSALRKALGPFLEITRETVKIKPEAEIYVDVKDLEEEIYKGEIESALTLYQGDFLAGFMLLDSGPYEDWHDAEQRRILNLVLTGLNEAVKRALDTKDIDFGLKLVTRLLELDPLDEQAHQKCILLHVMHGDRHAAVAQYMQCAAILKEELGLEPLEDTQQLYQHILQTGSLGEYEPDAQILNIPAQGTSFVGREVELFQINQLFRQPNCRLITLVGPGGCGKTRLGIEVARLVRKAFPDGVYFIPCEACLSFDFLIYAIANALNFNIDTVASDLDPEIQLIDYLQRRNLLIILDGFDALVSEAGRLSKILEMAPGLKTLVTSRQPLDLKGEWIYEVAGLPISLISEPFMFDAIDSVQLFMDRAKLSHTHFTPSQNDYFRIASICQLVEGMPLGIELAAAWSAYLPVDEIETQVQKSFDFLQTDQRDVPEKHRSIRAVFNGSWNLLGEDQKVDLCKLSVFPGDFDRNAAYRVADLDLNQLTSLVDRSLLHSDHKGRFNMHQLVRQFAFEHLLENSVLLGEVQTRYCGYYMDYLTQREPDLLGSQMLAAREEIRQELHHIHAAVRWGSLHWDVKEVQKILISLSAFFAVQGWHEALDTYRNLIEIKKEALGERDDSGPFMDPVILISQVYRGYFLSNLGQIDESESISKACLEPLRRLGLKAELSICLHNLGVNASFRGEYETAQILLEEAIQMGSECDFVFWPTYLLWLGHDYFLVGEYELGLTALKKCLDLFMDKGTLWGAAFALSKMGLAADGLEQHEQALSYHQKALAVFEEIENKAGIGYSISRMSMSACFLYQYEKALDLGKKALEVFEEIGHRWGVSSSFSRIGFAYLGMMSTDLARKAFIEALRLSKQYQMAPLSLYALSGLACTMMHEGQEQPGLALFNYVMQHPKTPKAYLDQALCLLEKADRMELQKVSSLGSEMREREPLEEVVDRYLYAIENLHL